MNFDIFLTDKLIDFFQFNESGYVYYIAALVTYLLILNLTIVVYVFVDSRKRGLHIVLSFLVSFFILVLNIPAFIIYLILRPHKTREERDWEELEKKLISQEVGETKQCINCKALLGVEHVYCPKCGVQNRGLCECGKLLESDWENCPYCGKKSTFFKPVQSTSKKQSILRKEIKIVFLDNLNSKITQKLSSIESKTVLQKFSSSITKGAKALYQDVRNLMSFSILQARRLSAYVSKLKNSSYNKNKSKPFFNNKKKRRSR